MTERPDLPATSPIQRIPPELLGKIFADTLPQESIPISLNKSPLVLIQVCRHWQRTAQATPELWLYLHMGSHFALCPVRIFRKFLENSGVLPLKVILPKRSSKSKEVINLLLDNLHRISDLQGYLTPWFTLSLYERRESFPIHAPLLKSVELGGWDTEKLPVYSKDALLALRECIVAHRLEKIHLKSTRFQLWVISFDPARVTEIHGLWILDISQLQSLEFLQALVNLELLEVYIHTIPDLSQTVTNVPDRIPIPSLRRLQIGVYPGFDGSLFLKPFEVPSVQHLTLTTLQGSASMEDIFDPLFGGKTIPRLKYLDIEAYGISGPSFSQWLSMFSELKTLRIAKVDADGFPDEWLESLNLLPQVLEGAPTIPPGYVQSRPTGSCPLLSSLIFHRCTLPWEYVMGVVRSRMPRCPDDLKDKFLRKVVIEKCNGYEVDFHLDLERERELSGGFLEIELIE